MDPREIPEAPPEGDPDWRLILKPRTRQIISVVVVRGRSPSYIEVDLCILIELDGEHLYMVTVI